MKFIRIILVLLTVVLMNTCTGNKFPDTPWNKLDAPFIIEAYESYTPFAKDKPGIRHRYYRREAYRVIHIVNENEHGTTRTSNDESQTGIRLRTGRTFTLHARQHGEW